MAKGKRVGKDKEVLVNYNAKVPQEVKDLTTALVDILKEQGIASQRELIEDMLKTYETVNPEAFTQARKLIELRNETRKLFDQEGPYK